MAFEVGFVLVVYCKICTRFGLRYVIGKISCIRGVLTLVKSLGLRLNISMHVLADLRIKVQ